MAQPALAEVERRPKPRKREEGLMREARKLMPEVGGVVASGVGILLAGPVGSVVGTLTRRALQVGQRREEERELNIKLARAHLQGRRLAGIREEHTPAYIRRTTALPKSPAFREALVAKLRAQQAALHRLPPKPKILTLPHQRGKLKELQRRAARFALAKAA